MHLVAFIIRIRTEKNLKTRDMLSGFSCLQIWPHILVSSLFIHRSSSIGNRHTLLTISRVLGHERSKALSLIPCWYFNPSTHFLINPSHSFSSFELLLSNRSSLVCELSQAYSFSPFFPPGRSLHVFHNLFPSSSYIIFCTQDVETPWNFLLNL